jgi:probable phosphoglycerate mutase
MTSILLVRHGHVAGIIPKRFRGRMDLPLSEEGQEQARSAAEFLAMRYQPQAVYSSPLQRCRDSAQALTSRLGMAAPTAVEGLTDTDYGQWQGRLATEVQQQDPARYARWREAPGAVTFPGGESLDGVAARAITALDELAERNVGNTIVVYSHDSVIRTVLLSAVSASLAAYHRLEIDPCSLSEIRYGVAGTEVVRINERTG